MVEVTEEEYKLFQIYRKIFRHSYPELSGSYFISGEAGEKDQNGLPEAVTFAPAMVWILLFDMRKAKKPLDFLSHLGYTKSIN